MKEFLDNYKKIEEQINIFVDDNLDFIKFFESTVNVTSTFTEEENLTAIEFLKRQEVNIVE
jgi:hypothetical protein